jgi:thiamine pyrophosphate-dependent acetolactate synthase large subunit-like protein
MEECDTLLMVGTSFPYGKFLPAPGQARVVQIDVEPTLIGLRLPVEAPVTADAASGPARCCRCCAPLTVGSSASTSMRWTGGARTWPLWRTPAGTPLRRST